MSEKLQLILNQPPSRNPSDQEKVALGAWVRLRDGEGGRTFQIVGVEEADPEEGRISSASPLARALLNRRTGEKVRFKNLLDSARIDDIKCALWKSSCR